MFQIYFKRISLLLLVSFSIGACRSYQTTPGVSFSKIQTGQGTEDLDLFSENGKSYLVVSCAERREVKKESTFYLIDTETDQSRKMEIRGLPDTIHLDLHGISVEKINGQNYLYAIDHKEGSDWHQILQFSIKDLQLNFEHCYTSPDFLINPNDLDIDGNGNMYVSNYLGRGKVIWQYLFNTKRSTVVKYSVNTQKWEFVLDHMAYANGVFVDDSVLYIATTRMHGLYAYPLSILGKGRILKGKEGKRVCDIKGLDNLIFHGGYLYTTAHPSNMKFLGHVKTTEKKSPSQIWKVELKTGQKILVFQDDGYQISAASTALPYKNKVYIGQIFDPFVGVITVK